MKAHHHRKNQSLHVITRLKRMDRANWFLLRGNCYCIRRSRRPCRKSSPFFFFQCVKSFFRKPAEQIRFLSDSLSFKWVSEDICLLTFRVRHYSVYIFYVPIGHKVRPHLSREISHWGSLFSMFWRSLILFTKGYAHADARTSWSKVGSKSAKKNI